jgi:phosphoglycerate dehydrogenase-like enzyme
VQRSELEQEMVDTGALPAARSVEKEMRGKMVSLAGLGRLGQSVAGMWRWTRVAQERYPAERLAYGLDWINDE